MQKMAASDIFYFTLWTATVFGIGNGCPEICSCSDKYERHFADCTFKELPEIPNGLPSNVTTLSLSANRISLITLGSFDNVTRLTSLWMANNEIVSIEEGTLAHLVHLVNLDISYNKITDFPWEDLQNLTALQLLKMNHNEMVNLPRDAFSNLKDLRSLRLNNNKFITIAEGTFDGLISLSHLQIYNNPFACTCFIDWLRDWILTTTISVPEQKSIVCATPQRLKGVMIVKLPESKCTGPNVTIITEPNIHNTTLHEDRVVVLTCEFSGNPKPLVVWNIHSKTQREEIALPFSENDSAESTEDSSLAFNSVRVFNNGTLIISHISKKDSGNYSCSATNEFGKAEDLVSVEVVASPKPTPTKKVTTTPFFIRTNPPIHQPVDRTSIFDLVHLPDLNKKDVISVIPTFAPTAEIETDYYEQTPNYPSRASKCGLTANTRYISNHAFNGSLDHGIKQYTFDFGVIALGVSETEAKVRLNPLLVPKERSSIRPSASDSLRTINKEHHGLSDVSGRASSNGLYLCVTADRKHSAVQWSRIKDGVNTYLFSGLRPGTNYSLCLTYRGEDCEVQVRFTTRRRVPNLLIIISVSICLLTVSTVPLLGATCFHMVYKYRSKTYKLILKAKDQYHMEKNLAANFNIHTSHTDSQRHINSSELDEEEGESRDGDKEADTEESVVTESFTLSQYRGNLDDCEIGSEYSDRLPLGAEAVNITSNYNYPSH
ncbi:immunoglobulin superfamily containing leucine-rich repeat protein 2-like [Myripristis murdjan]|uniref:immunoglobulin superfamily containing leucine-rich repeat protein 2-like n=1 Tax=Myripristis murdjan TaxID=586833 RepID=UPI0011763DE0|nr:immunoglobulin superfamily containing leucine-rich repeat protein 2-like [Myripristis murdjan]